MNKPHNSSAGDIRSDINQTRRRMDDTMDALAERLQPRHLLDEVLGLLRRPGRDGESHLTEIPEKLTQSTDSAMHAVVDTVKKNPLPALLIGAGIAWMIYERRRSEPAVAAPDGDYYGYDRDGNPSYDPDLYQDRPLQYPGGMTTAGEDSEGQSKIGRIKDRIAGKTSDLGQRAKEKISHAGEAAKDRLSRVGEAAREKASDLGEKAGEALETAKAATSRTYDRTKERVAATADQHPLELGLACLATGVVVGLALPTPRPIHRRLGPPVQRLRDRTREAGREMMEKGRHVADAAVAAAKDEAKSQGLTNPEGSGETPRAEASPPENPGGTGGDIREATQSGP